MSSIEFETIMNRLDAITVPQLPELMTPKEVASYLKVHYKTVENLMDEPDFIPVIKVGRQNRFKVTDVIRYIENNPSRLNKKIQQ